MKNRSYSLKDVGFIPYPIRVFFAVLVICILQSHFITANGNSTSNNSVVEIQQTAIIVTGIVQDSYGEPLVGVNVFEKSNPTNGVITGIDGDYSIKVSDRDAIIVLSFIGFVKKEVAVQGQTQINITLEEESIGLDEIVAIGYGTQKKANLTGATSIVKAEELTKRPVNNSSSMLQGRVAGLNIVQNSGQPGAEGFAITIRGISSFANSYPYVLIDGVEGSLSAVNPSEIENITVLKDAASAAIYGARAANGVILVTTKSGKREQKTTVTATANIGWQEATVLPDFIYDSVEYMELWNKGAKHTNMSVLYPEEMIEAYRNAAPGDPRFPNFNWMDYLFNTALRQDYQLSISGGSKKNSFYLNFGYMDQEGIMEGYGSKVYSTRFKLDAEVNDLLSVGFNTGFVYRDIWEPTNESIYEQMLYAYTMPPTMTPYLSDGSGNHSYSDLTEIWRNRNPQAVVDNPGYTREDKYEITPQAYIKIHPFRGFSWKTTASWRYDRTEKEHMYEHMGGHTFSTNEYYRSFEPFAVGVYHQDWRSSNIQVNSIMTYEKSLNENHNFNVLAGYEQLEMNYDTYYIRRPDYSSSTTTDINAGSEEDQVVSGQTESWSLQSFFGRLSYDYKGKYLVEGNLRYDGSSKIAKDYRWDLFPSLSVGWRVSEEGFMENVSWIENFKIRASIGELGNVNSFYRGGRPDHYPYQELLVNTSYPIGNSLETGVVNTTLSNPSLVWEKVRSYNLGIDYSMLRGLFGFELDIYKKETIGGHALAQIPASVGKAAPFENFRNMENRGVELVLRHANRIGDFKYNVDFTYDHYRNKITKVLENSWGRTSEVKGHPIKEYYMLDWIGIYQNQQQVDNLPSYGTTISRTQPGDLIFRDVNKDGEITVEPETGDRVFVSGYHPKFSYSFNINMEWKNLDLSSFWQGIAGKKSWSSWIGFEPFMQGGTVTKSWRNAWDGEGSTNKMPALYNLAHIYSYPPVNGATNDYHLRNSSYLRLKNLQIGYNLPTSLCNTIGINKMRVYVSGDNLLTFTDFENYDPEKYSNETTQNQFPQLRTYSVGASLTF